MVPSLFSLSRSLSFGIVNPVIAAAAAVVDDDDVATSGLVGLPGVQTSNIKLAQITTKARKQASELMSSRDSPRIV